MEKVNFLEITNPVQFRLSKDGADEQLEKELLNDWDEFELVNGAKKGEGSEDGKLATTVEDEDLDKEIDALLEEGGK